MSAITYNISLRIQACNIQHVICIHLYVRAIGALNVLLFSKHDSSPSTIPEIIVVKPPRNQWINPLTYLRSKM